MRSEAWKHAKRDDAGNVICGRWCEMHPDVKLPPFCEHGKEEIGHICPIWAQNNYPVCEVTIDAVSPAERKRIWYETEAMTRIFEALDLLDSAAADRVINHAISWQHDRNRRERDVAIRNGIELDDEEPEFCSCCGRVFRSASGNLLTSLWITEKGAFCGDCYIEDFTKT